MQIQSALENPQAVPNAMLDRYQQGMQPQVLPEDAKYEELRRARMTNASMGTQALQANPSQTPTIMAQKEMEIAQLKAMLDGAMRNGALQRQVSGLPMAMGQPMPPAAPPPMQPPAAPPPQPQPQPPQEAGLAALPAQNMAQGFAHGGIVSFSNGGGALLTDAEREGLDLGDNITDEYNVSGGYGTQVPPPRRATEGDVREAIYRQALMDVPTEQQAVAERRRLREEMGLGNVYKAREDRLAAREKEYEKEKEGRGLGALASSLAAFASAPRKGKIGAAAQSLQAQVQQNKALDRQFQLAISEAKDRIEDSKIKMAEGDIDAGIKQRETALKQVSDARKMLLDAGYKDEQIKAMMERIAASERSVAERIASAEAIAVMRAEVAEKIAGMQRESGGKTDLQQLSAAWFGKLKEENAKKPKGEQVTDEQLKVAAYQEAAKMLPSGVSAAAATTRADTSKTTAETRRSQAEDEAMARVRLTPAYRKLKREQGEAAAEEYAETEMRKRFPTSSTRGVLPYPQAGGKRDDPLGLR